MLALRDLGCFAVVAKDTLINNAGGTTLATGDVAAPSQISEPAQPLGYANVRSGARLFVALDNLRLAINAANFRSCTVTSATGVDLGGQVLTPGVYCYGGDSRISGSVTLRGAGHYIFRAASGLTTAINAKVQLVDGATATTLYWVPAGAIVLGANTEFKGSILSGASPVTLGDGATLIDGRVLSAGGVTWQNNQIRNPPISF